MQLYLPNDTAAVKQSKPNDVKCLHRLSMKSLDGEGSLKVKIFGKHLKWTEQAELISNSLPLHQQRTENSARYVFVNTDTSQSKSRYFSLRIMVSAILKAGINKDES